MGFADIIEAAADEVGVDTFVAEEDDTRLGERFGVCRSVKIAGRTVQVCRGSERKFKYCVQVGEKCKTMLIPPPAGSNTAPVAAETCKPVIKCYK